MFRFDEDSEYEILRLVDDIQRFFSLWSRGQAVELAVRHLWVLTKGYPHMLAQVGRHRADVHSPGGADDEQ
jgi:hypothetical protein